MSSKCPLCGKTKIGDSLFCPDCTVKFNSEYEVNVPTSENMHGDSEQREIENSEQKNEPEKVLVKSRLDKKAWKRQTEDKRSDSEKSYYELSKEKNTNKVRFTLIALFILAVVLVVALNLYNRQVKSDNLERSKWEMAQRENSLDSYLTYMDEYPQGTYVDKAHSNILSLKNDEAEAWQNLRSSENTIEFTDFLERYPQSPYERQVKSRLDSLIWESSLKENSAESFLDYINKATAQNISGDYIGEAQKRFKMLVQSTPIDEMDLEQIRHSVIGFFIALSDLSHEGLSEYLRPVIVRFNNSTNISSERMIGELMLQASKADAQSLKFDPEITKIRYEKLGNDTYEVNVPLQKIMEGSNSGVNQIKGYIVHLKLDQGFKIFSYYETKPYPTAP